MSSIDALEEVIPVVNVEVNSQGAQFIVNVKRDGVLINKTLMSLQEVEQNLITGESKVSFSAMLVKTT